MKRTRKFEMVLWICTICLFLVLLVSHAYNDIIVTTRHGINFWDILLNGDFLAFYDRNVTASGNTVYSDVQGCAYNILVYIVFAIWNLPLYLMERFASVDVMNSIPCLAYAKLLPVAAVAITAVIVKKILEELHVSKDQHSLLLYLYVSSTLLTTVIFITGQYDILSLIPQLLGVYAFIKGNDRQFVIWFGIAFCFKFFSLVIFLPLLLLRYKKIHQWIKSLAGMIAVWLPTKIPFWIYAFFSKSTTTVTSGGELLAAKLFKGMLFSSNIDKNVNIFIVVYAAIIIWCYLQEYDSETSLRKGIWVCMLSYAAFFGLMNVFPYWSILLAPFVTLVIAMAPQYLYINIILETVGYAGLVGVNMCRYNWTYFGKTLQPMIWSRILEGTRFHADYTGSFVYDVFVNMLSYPEIQTMIISVFIAAMIALAYITYPCSSRPVLQNHPDSEKYGDVLLIRFLVNTFICLLPIIAVFV